MIQAAVVVMTLLGCGDQAKSCDIIPAANPGAEIVWQNKSACEAAIPDALRKSENAPYPVITAQCDEKRTVAKVATPETRKEMTPPIENSFVVAEIVPSTENPSITSKIVKTTKGGYVLLKDGAAITASGISKGARYTYHGIRATIDVTKDVAENLVTGIGRKVGLAD